MSARARVADFWDDTIAAWLADEGVSDPCLDDWRASYQGRGLGALQLDAMPEPYIGPFARGNEPAMVMLGLNPGGADVRFQGRGGSFADEVRTSGYTAWAASGPYTSAPWEAVNGRNSYHRNRASFASRFLQREVAPKDLLYVELYPWHSKKLTGSIQAPHDVLNEFVWSPLSEVNTPQIFAFGAPWLRAAGAMGLGAGDELSVSWAVPSRSARKFSLPSGQDLIVLRQRGYAGPPGAPETELLRKALRA
ncbi:MULTISPECIES: hypothetical protein [unclassified Pseudoclavibacter]|uniref:anti-phage DNA glycosylase Brig1 n=1 Tax=unclassified Pseudoclavibacter TaxID=2615177 RepID=UPI0011B09F70|nr:MULTISPECIES: hypothetical protein [unclassified Pseudoclavibacter]